MIVNLARGVNDALESIGKYWAHGGLLETKESRNGRVRSFLAPVTTSYNEPRERVLRHPLRDANPFFHLFESLWMLGGRNDVKFLEQFNSTIGQFSDDGETLHGAYGHRWRVHYKEDQLEGIIQELRRSMNTRRTVLSMWDPYIDPAVARAGGLDVPCNTHAYFSFKNGALDLTVLCRSNDLVWGCYGANAVHMSMLLEYVSLAAVMPMGKYYQMSNDLHVYEKHWDLMTRLNLHPIEDPYEIVKWKRSPWLWKGPERMLFDNDVKRFLEKPYSAIYSTEFMANVVGPLAAAWKWHKEGDTARSIKFLETNAEKYDWIEASREWLTRRVKVQA